MMDYDIQTHIANKLDKVQEIIDLRRSQIQQLDELVKSQFEIQKLQESFMNQYF